MSIIVSEKIESRQAVFSRDGKTSTLDLVFNVQGTDSEALAKVAVEGYSPTYYGTGDPRFYRQQITLQPLGEELWLATVHYDTSGQEPLTADDSFEFSTTGGVQHVTQALSSVARYPATAPNYKGAIGVTDAGVEGIDIVVPRPESSETHYFAEISPAYKVVLIELTGKVNAAAWRGWAAGEVLFLGATARRQDSRFETPWSVTYQFAYQPSRSNFAVGDITVDAKTGWELMWVRYGQTEDAAAAAIVQVPKSVHLEVVYDTGDFTLLEID